MKLRKKSGRLSPVEIPTSIRPEQLPAKPEPFPLFTSKYQQEYCEQLVQHGAGGLSFRSFAGLVHVAETTIYAWAEKHPEFAEAKASGKARSLLYWEEVGRDGVFDTTVSEGEGRERRVVSRRLNGNTYRLIMSNRFGWREKSEQAIEINTPQTPEPDFSRLSTEELRVLNELMGKAYATEPSDSGTSEIGGYGYPPPERLS